MNDIPGYKIVRTLGRGGMATVYLAIQESFEREVALKVMSEALAEDDKFTARFLQEARVVSRLVHPNIVTVYDVGVQGKRNYLSMEYVPGMDLKQKRQFLNPPQVLQVIRDVAKALDFASKKGYVHRDVKPENIMLHDDDGRAVLMDFGIACIANVSSGMTQTGTAIGTPHYMSPEQAKGRPVDSRSDIYSLGVVLFQLLTGHVPYDADSAVAVGIKHVQEPIPRLPGNLRVLQPIIDRVLAKNPDDRYQTGAELVAAIDSITDDDLEGIQLATKRYASQMENSDPNAATVVSGQVAQAESAGGQNAPPVEAPGAKQTRVKKPRVQPGGIPKEEFLAVAEEDRREFHDEPEPKHRWPWALAAAIVLALAGMVYFRAYLPPQMGSLVDGLAGQFPGLSDRFGISPPDAQPSQVGSRVQAPATPSTGDSRSRVAAEQNSDTGSSAAAAQAASASEQQPSSGSAPGDSATSALPATGEGPASADSPVVGKARSLREELEEDLSVAPELATRYRETLGASPGDQRAILGLQELRDFHYRRLREQLENRNLARATSLFDSLKASFPAGGAGPDVQGETEYLGLQEQYQVLQQARELVDQGDKYLDEDALTSPAGANALESYRAALDLDANNPDADAGLVKLVERYAVLSRASLDEGNPKRAAELVRRGLAIDGDNGPLRELLADAEGEMERQAEIERLMSLARKQLEAQNLIAPRGESAYHNFKQVLALDGENEAALQGLADIEQTIIRETEDHINRNEFDQARALFLSAQDVFGSSERLIGLELALEHAIEADFLARQPRISEVLVSSNPTDSLGQSQAETLNVDRTIYIGFQYENFEAATSVVQAMLYDGSRTIQIAEVPVIVSGKSGVKFFQIDRPVEGFAEGGYNIDLLLNQKRLNTLSFKVERGQEAKRSSPAVALRMASPLAF